MGKDYVLEMSSIPKTNYIFQPLSLQIPMKYFKMFDGICKKFLWGHKRPQLRLERLQAPVDKGGLGLPKLLYYYYAFNLKHPAHWSLPPERALPWLEIEKEASLPHEPLMCMTTQVKDTVVQNYFIYLFIFLYLNGKKKKVYLPQLR